MVMVSHVTELQMHSGVSMINLKKIHIILLIFILSLNVSANKAKLKELFDFGINVYNYEFALKELNDEDFIKLIKNNDKIDIQSELIVNFIFYSSKKPDEAVDKLEAEIGLGYLKGENIKNVDFLFSFIKFVKVYFFKDKFLADIIDTMREFKLLEKLYENDPWIYVINALVLYTFSTEKSMESYELPFYDKIERAIYSNFQESKLNYATANFFKNVGLRNPSAHRLATVQYQKAIAMAPDNKVLKIVCLKNLIRLLEVYKISSVEAPVWLEELIYAYTIDIDPNDAFAYNNLAFLYATKMNRAEDALKLAQTAYDMRKEEASILDTLAYAHLVNGNFEEARKFFEKAYSIDSKNSTVLKHISDFYLFLDQRELAVKYLNEYIKIVKNDNGAKNNLAFLLALLDRELDFAKSLIDDVLSDDKNKTPAYMDTLGWILYKQGKYNEALKIFENIEEEEAEILIHQGLVHAKLQNYEKSLNFFRKALNLDSENENVLKNYILLYNMIKYNMKDPFYKEFIWMD